MNEKDFAAFKGAGSVPAQQAAFRESRKVVRPTPVDPGQAEADLVRSHTYSTLEAFRRQRDARPVVDPWMAMVESGYAHAAIAATGEANVSPYIDPDTDIEGGQVIARYIA
jgi:hypothetical protein